MTKCKCNDKACDTMFDALKDGKTRMGSLTESLLNVAEKDGEEPKYHARMYKNKMNDKWTWELKGDCKTQKEAKEMLERIFPVLRF